MKTCSMCGTLLFDDAEQCTKCGLVLSDQGSSQGSTSETAPQENPQASAEPEAPVSDTPPATVEEPSEPAPAEPATTEPEADVESETTSPAAAGESAEPSAGDDGPISETSAKRQKWLEEQDKIKAELANILGRVGKKKKPIYPPVAPGPGMVPVQVPMPTQAPAPAPGMAPTQRQVTAQIPAQAPAQVNPNILSNVGAQPTTQVANPPPLNPTTSAPPAPASARAPASAPVPAPAQAPAAPAPAPTTTTTTGGPIAGGEGGLSEVDKKELMNELDDLRNEGYNVSKLERIINENPSIAWKAFSDFLDDIEKLNQQKARVEQINTEGLTGFDTEKNNLLSQMTDPDLLTNYESQITQFENKLLVAKSEAQQQSAIDPEEAKKIEQSKKLIGLAKEAFRVKQYDKALDLFTKASERDPSNKEISFFIKKIEAKLTEVTVEASASVPEPVEPAAFENTYEEPSEEVVVAKKKKKKRKKVVSKGAPGPAGVPVGVQQEAPQPAPATMGVPGGAQVVPGPASLQPGEAAPPADGPPGAADGPRTAAEFEALGFNAYINKDYPKALEFYQKVLKIDPDFPNVQNIIGECQMRLGKK